MDNMRQWLEQIGLGEYADLFTEQRIDHDVLRERTEPDLLEFRLPFGDRKRLLRAIDTLDEPAVDPASRAAVPKPAYISKILPNMTLSTWPAYHP